MLIAGKRVSLKCVYSKSCHKFASVMLECRRTYGIKKLSWRKVTGGNPGSDDLCVEFLALGCEGHPWNPCAGPREESMDSTKVILKSLKSNLRNQ